MIQTALMSRVPHRRHADVRLHHSSIRRTINRIQKRHPWVGVSALVLATLIELACMILYIVAEADRIPNTQTESGHIEIDEYHRGTDMFIAQTTLCIVFLLEWIFMFVVDDYKKTFVLSGQTIVMLLTVLPQLILAFGSLGDDVFQSVWVPFFLRIWWLYYFLDELLDSFQGSMMTDLHRDLLRNVLSLFSTMITCIGVFHACELFTGTNGRISLFESMYFIVVTFGTIGYGDYFPTSTFSRMVTIIIMVVAIYRFPMFFSNLAEIARLRAQYTSFKGDSDGKVRHVIVAGTLGDRDVSFFLNEFFSGARQFIKLKIVLLSDAEFSQETRLLVNSPGYAQRVTLVMGSPTKRADLERCKAGSADAIFLVGDSSELSAVVDYGVVVRALSIHQFDARLPQHVMLKRERNSKYLLPIVASVMVKEKMKMSLLGLGAVLPGIIPLLVNLFRTYDAKSIENMIEMSNTGGGGNVGSQDGDGGHGHHDYNNNSRTNSPMTSKANSPLRSGRGANIIPGRPATTNAPFGGGNDNFGGSSSASHHRAAAASTRTNNTNHTPTTNAMSSGAPWLLEYEWSMGCELYTFDTPQKLEKIPFIAAVQALSHYHVILIGVIWPDRTVVLNPAKRCLRRDHRLVFIAEDDRKVSDALECLTAHDLDIVRYNNKVRFAAAPPTPTTSTATVGFDATGGGGPAPFMPAEYYHSDASDVVNDSEEEQEDKERMRLIALQQNAENDPDTEMFAVPAVKSHKKATTKEEAANLIKASAVTGMPLSKSTYELAAAHKNHTTTTTPNYDAHGEEAPTRSHSKFKRPWAPARRATYSDINQHTTTTAAPSPSSNTPTPRGTGTGRRNSGLMGMRGVPEDYSCYRVLLPEDILVDGDQLPQTSNTTNKFPSATDTTNVSRTFSFPPSKSVRSEHQMDNTNKVVLKDHYVLIDLSSAFSIPEMSEDARFEADHFAGMDLFNVLQPIKSRDDCAPVVLLARNESNHHFSKLWRTKGYDPINIIHGCGLNISDLKLCNLAEAKAVVVFSTGECADDNADAMSMLVVLAVNSLLRDAPRKVPVLVEVETTESLPLFPPYYTEDKLSALAESNFSFEPNFITGSCITGAMLDPALYQTYFNPELLRIVDALTSGTGRNTNVPGISAMHIHEDDHIGPTYGDILDHCLLEKVIPIALHRLINDTVNDALNGQRYIFCNPPRSTIRRSTDIVYYISM